MKRVYGNWSKPQLKPWIEKSKQFAITMVQTTDYVSKKNASDISLVVDAMDYAARTDCMIFVIVSSDSDFTPLAMRLREFNKEIIGFGEKKTVEAFRNACDEFIFTENMNNKIGSKNSEKLSSEEEKLIRLFRTAAEKKPDEEWTNLSEAGNCIKSAWPEFNIKTFAPSLSEYIQSKNTIFDVRHREGQGGITIYEYKMK